MDKSLHILVIPSWYPEFNGDYVGSFFREQAIAINKKKCKVGLIFPELKSLRTLKKIKVIPNLHIMNDSGLTTYRYLWTNWFIKQQKLQILAFKYLGYKLFKKYIKDNGRPDVIHCQSIFYAGFLGEYIFDKHKIPFLITEHNSGFYYKNQGFEKFIFSVKRIIKKSSVCLAVSENYSKYLTNLFGNEIKWKTHHNIVSDPFILEKIRYPKKNNFIFICVSRLSKIKNIPLLINSFKRFNDKFPNSELKLIGIGSEKKSLKKLVTRLDINKKVKFLGMKVRKEVINEINSSHAMIYASSFETFGVIFIESLALGKPVITTDCGSANEIINKKVGVILKSNDEDEMVSSMFKLYKNYDEYDPKYLRKYCKENFSEEILSTKLIKIYKEIINQEKTI